MPKSCTRRTERGGEVMLGLGASMPAAELFAQGLARRVSNVDDYLEKSPVVRSLTSGPPSAGAQTRADPGFGALCVTASGRDRVGLVTRRSGSMMGR